MIVDFFHVEIVADARSERGNDRSDLLVCKYLIDPFLFDIQRFAAKRQNGLKLSDTRLFCRSACGVALYDKEFVVLRLPARTSGELSDERPRIDAVLGARRVLCLTRRKPRPRRALRFFDRFVKRLFEFFVSRKRTNPFHRTALYGRTRLGIAELRFRLPFELHVLHFDG